MTERAQPMSFRNDGPSWLAVMAAVVGLAVTVFAAIMWISGPDGDSFQKVSRPPDVVVATVRPQPTGAAVTEPTQRWRIEIVIVPGTPPPNDSSEVVGSLGALATMLAGVGAFLAGIAALAALRRTARADTAGRNE